MRSSLAARWHDRATLAWAPSRGAHARGTISGMRIGAPTTAPGATPSASLLERAERVFLPQYRSPGLPDGLPWGERNGNCGPASIVNALRLVGLDVPGFAGERTQAVIDAARRLATGSSESTGATLKTQQAFALRAAGADVHVTYGLGTALADVRAGAVLLLGGDRAARSWPRRADDGASTAVANHAAVVAGYDEADGRYVVIDPALAGPVRVDAAQIAAFAQADAAGSMPRLGLLVRAPARG
ncbi:MAG: hypothetical protein JWM86_157 [Thermoleophilia bacterium]|nr:hypothetical protein [Thermoleophilia bacterium]